MKNDMRIVMVKTSIYSILDYIDSNISSYDTDGNVVLKKEVQTVRY